MAINAGYNATFTENNSTTVDIATPPNALVGDLLLLHLECDGNNGFPLSTTDAALGFTQIGSNVNFGSHTSAVYYKVIQAGDPVTYTLTCPSPGERGNVQLHLIKGAPTSNPIEGFSSGGSSAASTSPVFANYTPSEDDCLVFALLGTERGGNKNTIVSSWPTPFIEVVDNVNGPPGTGSASSSAAGAISKQTTATLCSGSASISIASTAYFTWFVGIKNDPTKATISSSPSRLLYSTTLTVGGSAFLTPQGTGKLELADSSVYSSATVITQQNIVSWSNTSIEFTFVDTSLTPNSTVYLYVTNDLGVVSNPFPISFGIVPYRSAILDLRPGHYWILENNSYADTGFGDLRPMNVAVVGGGGAIVTPAITEDSAGCWLINNRTSRREIADVADMNLGTVDDRTFGGWIMLNGFDTSLNCIWKEGGGVQNLAFLVGLNNTVLAQMADSRAGNNVQAFGDFKLKPNRPYHIIMRYSYNETPKEFRLFIDGVLQESTDGNPITENLFDSHSGDVNWGVPDGSLETGGVDILYAGASGCSYAHWVNFSDLDNNNSSALDADSEIRDILFRRGALPQEILSSATRSNMQVALDALANTEFPDWPHAIRVESPTNSQDVFLVADNITFAPEVSMQLEWRGVGELTWVLKNGSSLDLDKTFATDNGTITVITIPTFSIKCLDTLGNPIQDARVLARADSGGDLPSEDSVNITSSGTIATVTHSSHGLYDGLRVIISGADQENYNGIFNITIVDENTYTYNISSTAISPATGSIKATTVIASGDTDSDGIVIGDDVRYTSDQPVTVLARKGSSSTFYKEARSNSTLTIEGIELTLFMVKDE